MLSWVNEKSFGNSEAIEALFDKYLPQVIVYLRPLLAGSAAVDGQTGGGGSTVSLLRNEIEPQDVMLSEVHLINTCCQILEVSETIACTYMYICMYSIVQTL